VLQYKSNSDQTRHNTRHGKKPNNLKLEEKRSESELESQLQNNMVTEYKIKVPCAYCGKELERTIKTYCSGKCRVAACRDKQKTQKDYQTNIEKTLEAIIETTRKKEEQIQPQTQTCEHGYALGLCKFGCK